MKDMKELITDECKPADLNAPMGNSVWATPQPAPSSWTGRERMVAALSAEDAKTELLHYLIGVAQKTQGAEVWRALFAELLAKVDR